MQIDRNLKKIPSLLKCSAALIFSIVILSACGVSSEKSDVVAEPLASSDKTTASEQSTTAQSAAKPQAETTSETTDQKKSTSDAEVLEPQVTESNIKLEPIPEAAPSSQAVSESTAPVDAPVSPAGEGDKTVEIAKIEPAMAAPLTPAKPIPTSTGPDHFVITVGEKDQRHPKFGEGHQMGFLINGVPGGAVVVERGKTYRFDVATDPKHDVYISTKSIGWGASTWSEGVEGAYIYEGTMTFTPSDSAPEVLYYSCRNHPHMGGEIHVINPGEKVDIAKLTAASGGAASSENTPAKASQPEVSVAMVNQKLMFADMLVNSAASSRVKASANDEAKQTQSKAEALVAQAKEQLKSGDNQGAYSNAEEGLALLKQAAQLVPSEEEIAVLRENYEELLHSVDNFKKSHEESYQRMLKAGGEASAVDYDKKQVALLTQDAQSLAEKNDFVNANKKLEHAQHIITAAIQQMLNSQTIVYDLNFESPQEEYEYELKRFGGYEELIPVAIEQKKPNEGTQKLMESFVEKGQKMRSIAMDTAKAGDYPRAIAMMQDATKEVRRALRMVGVMQ